MQIFWVSSAVGQIKSINITFKKLIVMFFVLVLTLICFGVALQFFGFRMAIEYDPTIARKLGNLHTAVELENLHALYRIKLDELNKEIEVNRQKINELAKLNKKLSEMATPAILHKEKSTPSLGSSFKPEPTRLQRGSLEQFAYLSKDIHTLNKTTQANISETRDYVSWLETKPTKAPIQGVISLASGFGERTDPMNFASSFHPGVDFRATIGTPFFAAAGGRVTQVSVSPEYGNQVIVDHGHGFMTRYAHAQRIVAKQGVLVKQGDMLGTTGNTGKSTGPHLHFETIRNGERVDPLKLLIARP